MRRSQQVAAVVFLIVSLSVVLMASNMTYFDAVGPGPGFLPFWTGILLAILSAIWLLQVLLQPVGNDGVRFVSDWRAALRVISILAALLLFTALLGRLGFRLSAFCFLVFVLFALGRRDLFVTLTISLAGSFGVYHAFRHWLGVPLPTSSVQVLQDLGL